MNAEKIFIGYEIGTDSPVEIGMGHLIVTGITQMSGKTTTLEALIKRSGKKAVVFRTKIGERSFSEGTESAPYFKDRSDYEFVKSLIEAYAKEKLFLEKGTLMQLCKGSRDLIEIKKRVDETLASGKLRGIKEEIYVRLQHYLDNLIPQIQYASLSRVLNLSEGLNIMNLERFSPEAQSLIIEATVREVLNTMKDVIIVVPEAWKFIPQKYNNPCKRAVEEFIRQGAANGNYLWIDSQDMAGVDKSPLKQVSLWILGFQNERNEVKHTLDQIPLPKSQKPTEDEIMTLRIGQFYVSTYDFVKKVYVQPAWMDTQTAIKISKGKMDVGDARKPEMLVPYARQQPLAVEKPNLEGQKVYAKMQQDMIELRQDFFNKIEDVQKYINGLAEKIYSLQSMPQVNEAELIQKVLQKMPMQAQAQPINLNKEALINEILSKVPKSVGGVTYQVAPLEKIQKDFLEETKQKVLSDIENLSENAKRMLKYLESRGQGIKSLELEEKCFFMSHSGASQKKVSDASLELRAIRIADKDSAGWHRAKLKARLSEMLQTHLATEQEVEQVYNHVLFEMLK